MLPALHLHGPCSNFSLSAPFACTQSISATDTLQSVSQRLILSCSPPLPLPPEERNSPRKTSKLEGTREDGNEFMHPTHTHTHTHTPHIHTHHTHITYTHTPHTQTQHTHHIHTPHPIHTHTHTTPHIHTSHTRHTPHTTHTHHTHTTDTLTHAHHTTHTHIPTHTMFCFPWA